MADPREFYNHDIGEMSSPDMVAAQEKLFAGGAMKTAIKRFLDEFDMFANEIDRLRAENERLTAAHRFLLASSYCRKEMGCLTAGFLDLGGHDRFCAVRIAWDALHPEPTS